MASVFLDTSFALPNIIPKLTTKSKENIMKKILLLISLALATNLAIAQTTFTNNGLNYIITSDSTVAVGSNPSFVGDANIPNSVSNNNITYKVTDVDGGAFQNCTGLTSVILPDGMYYIKQATFAGCSSLQSVTIPASVFIYGDYAFAYCTGLTTIRLKRTTPSTFNELVFYDVNIFNINLDVPLGTVDAYLGNASWNKFKIITPKTFAQNGLIYKFLSNSTVEVNGYTSIAGDLNIPSSVTYNNDDFSVIGIGFSAFLGASSLTSVNIPNSVVSIKDEGFKNCIGLTSIVIPNSVTTMSGNIFLGCTNLESVTLSENLTTLGASSFSGCTSLKSIILPNSLTSIPLGLFINCSALTSVTIPSSITTIGDYAFYNNSVLSEVNVDWSLPIAINENAFYQINVSSISLKIPYGTRTNYEAATIWKDFIITERQTSIIESLNYRFMSDTTMIVSSNPTASGVVNIQNKIIYKGKEYKVVGIEANAFAGSSITGINFTSQTITNARMATVESSNLDYIGEKAFFNCTELTSIDIPSSVTSIEDSAFANCTTLEEVTVNWEIPLSINENVFEGVDVSTVELIVPFDTETDYKSALVWKNFAIVTGLEKVEKTNLKLYPNPVDDFVNIEIANANVVIFDSKGNIFKIFALAEQENTIDLSELSSGVYLIKITTDTESFSEKLVIK
jgi:hypothetical protein